LGIASGKEQERPRNDVYNGEIVDVVFESVGIKRLAVSLANLTII
jgi:NADPH:quinone reductase-like Zn-dependent oxidoreductase